MSCTPLFKSNWDLLQCQKVLSSLKLYMLHDKVFGYELQIVMMFHNRVKHLWLAKLSKVRKTTAKLRKKQVISMKNKHH